MTEIWITLLKESLCPTWMIQTSSSTYKGTNVRYLSRLSLRNLKEWAVNRSPKSSLKSQLFYRTLKNLKMDTHPLIDLLRIKSWSLIFRSRTKRRGERLLRRSAGLPSSIMTTPSVRWNRSLREVQGTLKSKCSPRKWWKILLTTCLT